MTMANLAEVVDRLVEHGRAPDTPAAAIRWGTRPDQQVVAACLEDLPRCVREVGLKAPAVVVVGDVVGLRQELDWFERLPLFGRRVLVTRPREQAGAFASALREAGAMVFEVPVIELLPPEDWTPVDAAIEHFGDYDWVAFTSANGVRAFCRRVLEKGRDARAFGRTRICAIGPETAQALEDYGLRADLVPDEYVAEAVAQALAKHEPKSVLIPRARIARDVLPAELRSRGADVDVVEVYRTEAPEGAANRLKEALPEVDVITFTSSSTVTNFMRLAGGVPDAVKVACIGPITAQTAREHGLTVDVVADEYTTQGLKDALVAYYSASTSTSRKPVRS